MRNLQVRAGVLPALLVGAGALSALGLAGCSKGGGTTGGGSDTIATVGSTNVTRDQLRDYLELAEGEQGLQRLVDYELVMQRLEREKLQVSDEEVNQTLQEQLKNAQDALKRSPGDTAAAAQVQQLQEVIQSAGPRLDALQRSARYTLGLFKLITKDIKATDAELKNYFEQNRARYDTPEKVTFGSIASSTKTRATLMAQQLKSKSKTFAQLVTEQKKAQDPAAIALSAESQTYNLADMPPQLKTALTSLKPGQTSGALALGQGAQQVFLIAQLKERLPAKKADFNEFRRRVEQEYKIQKLAEKSPASASSLGGQVNPLEIAQASLLAQLRGGGNVKIVDSQFARVSEAYRPAASGAGAASSAGAPSGGGAASGNAAGGNAASSGGAPAGGAATGNTAR